jgi:hypothetical protein
MAVLAPGDLFDEVFAPRDLVILPKKRYGSQTCES